MKLRVLQVGSENQVKIKKATSSVVVETFSGVENESVISVTEENTTPKLNDILTAQVDVTGFSDLMLTDALNVVNVYDETRQRLENTYAILQTTADGTKQLSFVIGGATGEVKETKLKKGEYFIDVAMMVEDKSISMDAYTFMVARVQSVEKELSDIQEVIYGDCVQRVNNLLREGTPIKDVKNSVREYFEPLDGTKLEDLSNKVIAEINLAVAKQAEQI
ncbi:hypothetical protein HYO65_gp232 [Tenacibaculum phage PTm1]|uniref:Uncharacterized protein n=2 Tax=Shirahamavirus PTm1 TaxID=2846435 RepID=A0A5S9C173_9CAUD|nr:hypothetical protein HYO65_gp232 [Tenacibaculum phage PTm1]BBI90624.1 hypothetical protein [Tenacibaculum phage PTm1]BBI90930.1 hypothetical protein [Tenacibaculum phage PTm5]